MRHHPTELLSAFLDEELAGQELTDLTSHLADCIDCRAELDSLASVRSQVRALPLVQPAPGVISIERRRVQVVPRWRRGLVGATAAAVVVLVIGVGVGANSRGTVPLPLDQAFDQHVARASVDSGFNVLQVQAVANR